MALYGKNISVGVALVMVLIVLLLQSPTRAKMAAITGSKCSSRRPNCPEEILESHHGKYLAEDKTYLPTIPGHSPSVGHSSHLNAENEHMHWYGLWYVPNVSDTCENSIGWVRQSWLCCSASLASWCIAYAICRVCPERRISSATVATSCVCHSYLCNL